MAGQIFVADTTAESLLASSSEKTLIRLTSPSSHAVLIKEWGVFFDGVSVTDQPIVVKLCIDTTAETGMTAHTPIKRRGVITASQCVVQTMGASCSINAAGIYAMREIHPQSGYQEKFSFGDEIAINGTVSIHVNSPTSLNAIAEIVYEE